MIPKALTIGFTVLVAALTAFVEPIRNAVGSSELVTYIVTQVSLVVALLLPSPTKKPEL